MSQPRILIVDDEASIRDALQRWFDRSGFDVTVASDGQEGVDAAQAAPFDVVIMDLEMPRLHGKEAIRILKQSQPHLPIIVLTGYSGATMEALELGAAQVVVKPVRLRDLEADVRKHLTGEAAGPNDQASN